MTKYEKIIKANKCICSDIDCIYEDTCPYYTEEDLCVAIKVRETIDYIKAQRYAWNELKETIRELVDQEDTEKSRIAMFLLNYMDVQEEHIEEALWEGKS